MARLTGGIFIMFSVMVLSLYHYFKNQYRLQALQEIRKALVIFYSYIEFSAQPLPYIFQQVSLKCGEPAQDIFKTLDSLIEEKKMTDIAQMWRLAVEECGAIQSQDKEVIKGIGNVLGKLDKQLQLKNITLTIEAVKHSEKEIMEKISKNGTIYIRVGAMLGLLLIILLI